MTKSILEEAVDDVQSLKKAAEENAKRMLLEAISPNVKQLIENQLDDSAEKNSDMYEIDAVSEAPKKVTLSADDDDADLEDELDSDDIDVELEDDEDEDDEPADVEIDVHKEAQEPAEGDDQVEITSDDLRKAFSEVLNQGLKEVITTTGGAKFDDASHPEDGEYGLAHKAPGEAQWADAKKVLNKAGKAKQVTKETYEKKITALQRQLAQYAEALKYLKKNLNEMNLFNAKLIYTTRLLQNPLNNKQKLSVVESIDAARNKSEVELVYKTLSESLKIAGAMNENRKIKGPKASRYTSRSSTVITEGTDHDTQANRWAKIAGLID